MTSFDLGLLESSLTINDSGAIVWKSPLPLLLESGDVLEHWQLVFEVYGEINAKKNNVILIHHALSANAHVTSHAKNSTDGWWESAVGIGKAIDTDKFFVICINNLGSCFGSSGPTSINPSTGKAYGCSFPKLTSHDIIKSQKLLLESLAIDSVYAVIGNSMGGMLSLDWSISFGVCVKRYISVSSCYKPCPVSVAYHQIQKEIIMRNDRCNGNLESSLTLARKIGLLTYRNPAELNSRFAHASDLIDYIEYNASKFSASFDTNSYLSLLEVMDQFDVTAGYDDILEPFKKIHASSLIISVSSDLLFPPYQQYELYQNLISAGVNAKYSPINSEYGHDAFYCDSVVLSQIANFLGEQE